MKNIEGPSLPVEKKRRLVSKIYEWSAERVIVIIHENPDENVARGKASLRQERRKR